MLSYIKDKKTCQNNNITWIGAFIFIMNKEEILKKSRDQKEDEGTIYADHNDRRYGVIAFSSIFKQIFLTRKALKAIPPHDNKDLSENFQKGLCLIYFF